MKTKFLLLSSIAGPLAVTASIAAVLFAGTACQTKKGAGPKLVGDDVKMMEVRHVIQTQISDPARSVALLNRVSYAETQLGEINEEYVKYSKKFGKVTANHSKGASDLHLILREWEAQSSSNRHRITETLLDMKNYTSAEEWPAISTAFMNSITKQSDRYKVLHYTPNS